jgi:hypothetical protein
MCELVEGECAYPVVAAFIARTAPRSTVLWLTWAHTQVCTPVPLSSRMRCCRSSLERAEEGRDRREGCEGARRETEKI